MSIVLDLNVFQKIVVLMIVAKFSANFFTIVSFVNIMTSVRMNTKKWGEGVTEQDKLWIEKCKEDWNYTICVDSDEIFVVHTGSDEVIYTFSEYGYHFALNLLIYLGCDADYV